MNNMTTISTDVVVLNQKLNLIPREMINHHALETGVEAKARRFSVMRHLSAVLFARLSQSMGLNDL